MGSSFSEKHYGFFRGIVIQNNDPDRRGRVKIFIPEFAVHLARELGLPPDKLEARFVGGGNISTFLTPEINEKLKSILKWAEQSHPLIGPGASGTYDAKNNIATVGDGHRGRPFEPLSDDSITPSGESVGGKAPFSVHAVKGSQDTGYKTGKANVYNDSLAPTAYNNALKGSVSIPKVGAQVWVFFENGSLDYPVYFGYVFDKNDWNSISNPQEGNPDLNYPGQSENNENADTYYSTGKNVMNYKGGSLEFVDTDGFEKIKLSHYSGSFLEMSNHVVADVNVENKNTIVNEDWYISVKGDLITTIEGDAHYVYKGYLHTTYGDMENKFMYEDWQQTAAPAFEQAAMFSDKSIAPPNPTQPGSAKGGPNDTYKLPPKLGMGFGKDLNVSGGGSIMCGLNSTGYSTWSQLITPMNGASHASKDQIKALGVTLS